MTIKNQYEESKIKLTGADWSGLLQQDLISKQEKGDFYFIYFSLGC